MRNESSKERSGQQVTRSGTANKPQDGRLEQDKSSKTHVLAATQQAVEKEQQALDSGEESST